jgi:hypothetical protein
MRLLLPIMVTFTNFYYCYSLFSFFVKAAGGGGDVMLCIGTLFFNIYS